MDNKQLISILNYNVIGKGILNEAIGFNQDLYEFVDIKTYSDDTVFNIAKEFIENHGRETVDYIKWCFALIHDCDGKTYDVIFDIVKKYTKAENKNYYWNDYLETFVPREFLNKAINALEKDAHELCSYEVKNGLGEYISIIINNNKYKILNDNEKYVFRDESEDICYFKNTEELLDYVYKLANEKSYDERILNKYLKNYSFVGRDVLEHEVIGDNSEDSLYWININSLSDETINAIGKDFIESNPKEAEKFAKYVLGMENEYPNICDFIEGIIQENVLELEKESYYWSTKFAQVMPREMLSDLKKYLLKNNITFAHMVDSDEYIEIPLPNNSKVKIHGFSYNDILGKSSEYCMETEGNDLYIDEVGILTHLERVSKSLCNKNKYTLKNTTYINYERNWLLQENMVFDDDDNGIMIKSNLQVFDIANDMTEIEDEMLNNNVWNIEWNKISSFTKKINKFN